MTGSSTSRIAAATASRCSTRRATFVVEKTIAPETLASGSAFVIALSPGRRAAVAVPGRRHEPQSVGASEIGPGGRGRVRPRWSAGGSVLATPRHECGLPGQHLTWGEASDGAAGAEVWSSRRSGGTLISRVWRGWTRPEDAGAYESLLLNEVLPGIAAKGIPGYQGRPRLPTRP